MHFRFVTPSSAKAAGTVVCILKVRLLFELLVLTMLIFYVDLALDLQACSYHPWGHGRVCFTRGMRAEQGQPGSFRISLKHHVESLSDCFHRSEVICLLKICSESLAC
eukprot:5995941-Amphidinium_carterae.1